MSDNSRGRVSSLVAGVFGASNTRIERLEAEKAVLIERVSELEGQVGHYRGVLADIKGRAVSEEVIDMAANALTREELERGDFLTLIRADLLEDKARQLEEGVKVARQQVDKMHEKMPELWTEGFSDAMEDSIKFLRHEAEVLRKSCQKNRH